MAKHSTTLSKQSTVVRTGKNNYRKNLPDSQWGDIPVPITSVKPKEDIKQQQPKLPNGSKLKGKPLLGKVSSPDKYFGDIILTGVANKPESQMTAVEKMDIARAGVSKTDLENLKEKAALDYEELSKALSVTRATLINKKGEEKFNAALSERIVGLADIYSYGYSVFEDEDKFNKWMFRSNHALGGRSPYYLIDNQFGREEVRNIIGRIEYGLYS